MRRIIASTFVSSLAALSTVAGPALAADIQAPAPVYSKNPVMVPSPNYDWSGFYLGANVGGSWGHAASTNTALDGTFVASGSRNDSAVIGGGQIGYNFMVSP